MAEAGLHRYRPRRRLPARGLSISATFCGAWWRTRTKKPSKSAGSSCGRLAIDSEGPLEHNDPPGYQSREAVSVKAQRPTGNVAGAGGLGVGLSYEELQGVNNIIVGTPETVTRKLSEVIERLSPGYLHIYGTEGAMDNADVMRSIQLLGQEVIPALHEIQLKPYE